jgi:hypothetical protein
MEPALGILSEKQRRLEITPEEAMRVLVAGLILAFAAPAAHAASYKCLDLTVKPTAGLCTGYERKGKYCVDTRTPPTRQRPTPNSQTWVGTTQPKIARLLKRTWLVPMVVPRTNSARQPEPHASTRPSRVPVLIFSARRTQTAPTTSSTRSSVALRTRPSTLPGVAVTRQRRTKWRRMPRPPVTATTATSVSPSPHRRRPPRSLLTTWQHWRCLLYVPW